MQTSFTVQKLPSSHAVPFEASGDGQRPVAGSQILGHCGSDSQTTGSLPTQAPAWQVSDWVQASPSVQLLPSGLTGSEQVPVAGSQTPASWHWSRAAQTTGLVPTQAPAWQVSDWVQASPSVQALPLGLVGFEQVPFAGSQVPASWH